jgi:hypothetical protein
VRIGAYPVGIETAAFALLAQGSVQLPFVKRVIQSLGGRALIIGVDRLDYAKGIAQRLSAFERFLQTQPDWRGKVTYLQIAPQSRTEIAEYADLEREIGSAAGHINGAYGEADWTPIRYINRAYSHSTLAGLYRAACVGLVTPLRDGMNLVAKEYVASQNPDDPGVLILSRFAGAAQECKAALLVNPYDPDSVAAAIGQALSMPLAERRQRHDSVFQVLSHNDIQHWADSFLAALERQPIARSHLQQRPFAEFVMAAGVEWRWQLRSEAPRLGCRIVQRNRQSSSHPTENGNFANSRRVAFRLLQLGRLRPRFCGQDDDGPISSNATSLWEISLERGGPLARGFLRRTTHRHPGPPQSVQ